MADPFALGVVNCNLTDVPTTDVVMMAGCDGKS